jgi:hypothetical protein
MAAIFWPENLPYGLLAAGLTIQPQNNVLRTKMDAGAAKTRRRYTARTLTYSGKQILTPSEFKIFENFYHNEIADGALRFNFTDPVSLETAEFRFTKEYIAIENEGYIDVTLPLERL